MTNINTLNPEFNTREEYIAYRDAWRAEYKELSKKIRQMKINVKDQQRNGADDTDQSSLAYQRKLANRMMVARTAATTRMWEQREAVPAE